MKVYQLKYLWQQRQATELKLLFGSLLLSMVIISSLNILNYALERKFSYSASHLLGADLILESSRPINEATLALVKDFDLAQSQTVSFYTMLSTKDKAQLVEIRAVDEQFPLRGTLKIASNHSINAAHTPKPGTLWVANNLLPLLSTSIGATVNLGQAQLQIDGNIEFEPGRAESLIAFAPSAIMNLQDLEKTQIIQPGSRLSYQLHLAGPRSVIEAFENALPPSQAIERISPNQGQPLTERLLKKSQDYLGLLIILVLVMGGSAIAISAEHFSQKHYSQVAIFRTMGMTTLNLLITYFGGLLLLGLSTAAISLVISYGLIIGTNALFPQLLNLEYELGLLAPGIISMAICLLFLLSFTLQSLVGLSKTPPLQFLNQVSTLPQPKNYLYLFLTGSGLLFILLSYVNNRALTLMVLSAFILLIAVAYALASMIFYGLAKIASWCWLPLRLGIFNLHKRIADNLLQLVAFSLCFAVLMLLYLTQHALIPRWQDNVSATTPNYFAVNISPADTSKLNEFFNTHQLTTVPMYPIIRGRLIKKNQQRFHPESANAQHRLLNLTYMAQLPEHNQILQGKTWGPELNAKPVISIESGFAKRIGAKLGDSLSFEIAEQVVTAKIINIRRVHWETFQPNFFVIFPVNLIQEVPATFITSFYLPDTKRELLSSMIRNFPNITFIDIDASLKLMNELFEKIGQAIRTFILLTLSLGLMILYASTQATLESRKFESALLRTFGASRRLMWQALLCEYGLLGGLAGLLGTIAAMGLAQQLATQIFDVPYIWDGTLIFKGILGGAVLLVSFGLWGARKLPYTSPLEFLKR
jgi:putative ABC transport system permease protein